MSDTPSLQVQGQVRLQVLAFLVSLDELDPTTSQISFRYSGALSISNILGQDGLQTRGGAYSSTSHQPDSKAVKTDRTRSHGRPSRGSKGPLREEKEPEEWVTHQERLPIGATFQAGDWLGAGNVSGLAVLTS